ncbi:putative alpha beta hydrolase fold-1 protein [Neofusicoccum parvum UCRNP2]|uniref:Putative alpha beta hydrolase fold-1 protein n=1 Tax=Botryosphaeria parva (strain UCR-NP2) TaxID=1287680 RepID=R1G740_BOTPV|nr:putative alpha beta hydrolase fold-1 protein [Neofusicoccum parvum UCRNP2]
MPPRLSTLFHLSPSFDPTHRFTTSSLLSPLSLGLARALIATYGVTTIIVSLALRHQSSAAQPSPAQSFSYFSTITWWGITSYHAFAALHTLAYARTGRAPLERWWAGLQVAHSVLWSTIAVFPLLVTVIFWGVQYKPGRLDSRLGAWSDVSAFSPPTQLSG